MINATSDENSSPILPEHSLVAHPNDPPLGVCCEPLGHPEVHHHCHLEAPRHNDVLRAQVVVAEALQVPIFGSRRAIT